MSVDIYVTAPPGLPDPKEPIFSFVRASGNIMMAPKVLGYRSLDDIPDRKVAASILVDVIAELDKGNAGGFSDQWCVDADLRWSGGKEMREAWEQVRAWRNGPGPDYLRSPETYWGHVTRDRLRKDAMRFLLYYLAGYEIRWSP